MRLLVSASLAVALTPVFVALPTVSFASPDRPHPVAPRVATTPIAGVDAGAAAALRERAPARSGQRMSALTTTQNRARFTVAGVSWARTGQAADQVTVQVRVREDDGWSGWETLSASDDGPESGTGEASSARIGTAPLVTDGATGIQVRVDTPDGRPLPDLRVTTIDPGTSAADDDLVARTPAASASAAAITPTIITRAQWGADESLRGSTTYNSTVKAVVIHHTAGSNDYTTATAAAQVRGIYAYDTQGLGWSDIAYNFLVDKFGRIYEGRAGSITRAVRGAHAMGFNTDTMGISAIGNYETAAAPAVMVDAMAKVAGWKLSQYGVDPTATTRLTSAGGTGAKYAAGVTVTLPTVGAHQNTSYTLCPGKYLSPQMATIRTKAASYAQYSTTTGPAPVETSKLYATYGTLTLATGSTGYAVRDLQLELTRRGYAVGAADGDFGPATLGGVQKFQQAAQVAVTGKVTANDWKALSGLAYTKLPPPPPVVATVVPGFDADGRGDVVGRTGTGDLYYYPGRVSAVAAPVRVGSGWNIYRQVVSPGDLGGDGKADVLAVTSTGEAYAYRGTGTGKLYSRALVATGWSAYTDLVTPGDWTGDKKPDLLARKANGELWLLPGNGTGGFATARRIGTGWQMFAQMITPGDVTGDGRADLIARTPANANYVYAGTGKGTFAAARALSATWGDTTRIFGVR